MASPTAPTTTTIATEALIKAGYSTPTSALLARAWYYFGNEIKADIWSVVKDLKMLQTETVIAVSKGIMKYSFPSDFSSLNGKPQILDGVNKGVCQAGGSTTTVVLASTEDVTEDWLIGKEILIYLTDTPTTAYIAQCTAYNTTTKTATVTPAWTPSPDTTYSYLITDIYYPLDVYSIIEQQLEHYPTDKDKPITFHPIGNEDYGEFVLFKTPDKVYGLKIPYYANLMTLDESGTLHSTLLSRWRNVFIQGIKAKQLEDDDDDRAGNEMARYIAMVQGLTMREKYGMELSLIQSKKVW